MRNLGGGGPKIERFRQNGWESMDNVLFGVFTPSLLGTGMYLACPGRIYSQITDRRSDFTSKGGIHARKIGQKWPKWWFFDNFEPKLCPFGLKIDFPGSLGCHLYVADRD